MMQLLLAAQLRTCVASCSSTAAVKLLELLRRLPHVACHHVDAGLELRAYFGCGSRSLDISTEDSSCTEAWGAGAASPAGVVKAVAYDLCLDAALARRGAGSRAMRSSSEPVATLGTSPPAAASASLLGDDPSRASMPPIWSRSSSMRLRALAQDAVHLRLQLLQPAQGLQFSVVVTEGRPDGTGIAMAKKLDADSIPVTLVLDSGVGYIMDRVDMVLTGADAVVENGGIINKLGTYGIALAAQ
ncbi:Translation initiation factor eIF-2B subunit alpha, partial [Tetrabaena socialis]